MKRSEINGIIKEMEAVIAANGFSLPPFARWTPQEWTTKNQEYDEIRDNMLGWDVTDYGLGTYNEIGLALLTIRNGSQNNPKYKKPYAEKLLLSRENQITPMHFHWKKMEDIINRGGGHLMIQVYNATKDEQLADTDVTVNVDARSYTVAAGTIICLTPGESITLQRELYHKFWAEEGSVLIGEVSECNDDNTDNRFLEAMGRFPAIEEDEPAYRLLCNEYPR